MSAEPLPDESRCPVAESPHENGTDGDIRPVQHTPAQNDQNFEHEEEQEQALLDFSRALLYEQTAVPAALFQHAQDGINNERKDGKGECRGRKASFLSDFTKYMGGIQ